MRKLWRKVTAFAMKGLRRSRSLKRARGQDFYSPVLAEEHDAEGSKAQRNLGERMGQFPGMHDLVAIAVMQRNLIERNV
jgi:hypothetical protein